MNPHSALIPAVMAAAIVWLRLLSLAWRACDGRWSVEARNSMLPNAPYRANPGTSRLANGAMPPIVFVVGLATVLSVLVVGSMFVPVAEQVLWRCPNGSSMDLIYKIQQVCSTPSIPLIAPGDIEEFLGLVACSLGWLVAAFLLWRSGSLVFRTSPRESTRAVAAASFTLVLTATTRMHDRGASLWYRPEAEPMLVVALAISICLLFVAVVTKRSVSSGTVIGAPDSVVSRTSSAH